MTPAELMVRLAAPDGHQSLRELRSLIEVQAGKLRLAEWALEDAVQDAWISIARVVMSGGGPQGSSDVAVLGYINQALRNKERTLFKRAGRISSAAIPIEEAFDLASTEPEAARPEAVSAQDAFKKLLQPVLQRLYEENPRRKDDWARDWSEVVRLAFENGTIDECVAERGLPATHTSRGRVHQAHSRIRTQLLQTIGSLLSEGALCEEDADRIRRVVLALKHQGVRTTAKGGLSRKEQP